MSITVDETVVVVGAKVATSTVTVVVVRSGVVVSAMVVDTCGHRPHNTGHALCTKVPIISAAQSDGNKS